MHRDPRRDRVLRECEKLIQPDKPEHLFDELERKLREVKDLILS